MKTKRWIPLLLCLGLCLCLLPTFALAQEKGNLQINETNFPDSNFRQYVIDELAGGKNYMTKDEVEGVIGIGVESMGIVSLKGVEHFTSLNTLSCWSNQLTSLDVSHNTALKTLKVNDNQLTSLDVSHNTALDTLDCSSNQLTVLDVSKNTALERLGCRSNQLKALDVSNNPALTFLYCADNQLTALDVSKNTSLTRLSCYDNQLTSLDVSKNTALTSLNCESNQLTSLDVSKNTLLEGLYCSNNQLTSLDVSKNTSLVELGCGFNQLSKLDVSKNTALTDLRCYYNQLTSLDVSKNTALTILCCYINQLSALDVSRNTLLTELWCHSNQLTALDVSKNTALTRLLCRRNKLASMDLSQNINLDLSKCKLGEQTLPTQNLALAGGSYTCDLSALLIDPTKVTVTTEGATYNGAGVFTLAQPGESFAYEYDTGHGVMGVIVPTQYQGTSTPTPDPTPTAEPTATPTPTPAPTAQAPTIVTQPKDAKVKSGAKAKFTVKAKEKNVSYQWYEKAPDAADWAVMNGETKNALTVTASGANNGYQYRCLVKNKAGGQVYSNAATLTVTLQPPVIKTQPKDANVKSGAKAKLSVKATGKNITYTWYERENADAEWKAVAGGNKNTLQVTASKANDGHQFYCHLENGDGQADSKTVTLTVKTEAPTIKTQPKNVTVKSGKKAKLSVKATGKNLKYQWFERANGDAEWTEVTGGNKSSLQIAATKAKDGHQFYCHVSNADGAVDSAVATLTVTPEAPKFTTQPKDAKVKIGAKAKFKVKATPKNVSYQWYYRENETAEWKLIDGATKATYEVKAEAGNIGWQFRCLAKNDDGEAWSKVATLLQK